MRQYILVENRQIIHLGPMPYRPRMFKDDLLYSLEVDYPLPQNDDPGYLKINDNIEIIPITVDSTPPYDINYHYLSGPFYNYSDEEVEMYYTVGDLDLNSVKINIKKTTAPIRYQREISGTTINFNGIDYYLDTTREARQNYLQKYISMNDGESVNWKFSQGFVNLSKEMLLQIITAIENHVQSHYDWELNKHSEIDACTTIEEIKMVEIVPPIQF